MGNLCKKNLLSFKNGEIRSRWIRDLLVRDNRRKCQAEMWELRWPHSGSFGLESGLFGWRHKCILCNLSRSRAANINRDQISFYFTYYYYLLESWEQCDQIGRFFSLFSWKRSSPNAWWRFALSSNIIFNLSLELILSGHLWRIFGLLFIPTSGHTGWEWTRTCPN